MFVKNIDNSLLILNYNFDSRSTSKVGIFDLDSTLLKYYPNKVESFEYMYKIVPQKLREIYNEGYKLVVVSNQSSINKEDLSKLKIKLKLFTEDLNLPIIIFLSIKRDRFRKPCTGIFKYLKDNYFDTIPSNIFFVGDAAGPRISCYNSYFDIKFAYNCNIPFFTPEEYFLNEKINPKFNLLDITKYTGIFIPKYHKYIFIYGYKKYSGVTFFINKYYKEYTVNNSKKLIPKNVYINCNDISLIKKSGKDSIFYILDHSKEILDWCKGFFYTSGMYYKKEYRTVRKSIIKYIEDKIENVERVPFIYDESEFTDEQKEIARLQL